MSRNRQVTNNYNHQEVHASGGFGGLGMFGAAVGLIVFAVVAAYLGSLLLALVAGYAAVAASVTGGLHYLTWRRRAAASNVILRRDHPELEKVTDGVALELLRMESRARGVAIEPPRPKPVVVQLADHVAKRGRRN